MSTTAPARAPLLAPPALAPGDLVAVVAPAGPASGERVAAGTAILRAWGLRVRPPVSLPPARSPWLAGTDEARADALVDAWCDPEVRAVWTARGGVGSHRVPDRLDLDAMADAGPRLLVGYSDVTALHQVLGARLGLAGVHGAGVASLPGLRLTAREALRAVVTGAVADPMQGRPGAPGTALAPVVGGNLTVLAAGAGAPGVLGARGAVALLEDVGERPYRLDRALTQLRRSGWLDGVLGVAVGQLTDCGDPDEVRALVRDELGALGVPVVTDLPLGHEPDSAALLLGATVALDGDAGTLTPRGRLARRPADPRG